MIEIPRAGLLAAGIVMSGLASQFGPEYLDYFQEELEKLGASRGEVHLVNLKKVEIAMLKEALELDVSGEAIETPDELLAAIISIVRVMGNFAVRFDQPPLGDHFTAGHLHKNFKALAECFPPEKRETMEKMSEGVVMFVSTISKLRQLAVMERLAAVLDPDFRGKFDA